MVGGHNVGNDTHGFAWHNGSLTELGVLPGGDHSLATAVNQAGDIVGSSGDRDNGGPVHAVLWHHGTVTDLGSLGGNSSANSINDGGVIAGDSHLRPGSPESRASSGGRA